jgi:hypothetical protein
VVIKRSRRRRESKKFRLASQRMQLRNGDVDLLAQSRLQILDLNPDISIFFT